MGGLDWFYSACEIIPIQPIETKVTKVIYSNKASSSLQNKTKKMTNMPREKEIFLTQAHIPLLCEL
jgi:hypothetical protein